MIRFWKTKIMTATGMVMRTAAASLSGYRFPDPNAPVNRPVTGRQGVGLGARP